MRLTSWNGSPGADPTRCLTLLDPLRPDVVTLQECRRPSRLDRTVVWHGPTEKQGLAVARRTSDLRVEPLTIPGLHPTVLPVLVSGPSPLSLGGSVDPSALPSGRVRVHEGLRRRGREAPAGCGGRFQQLAARVRPGANLARVYEEDARGIWPRQRLSQPFRRGAGGGDAPYLLSPVEGGRPVPPGLLLPAGDVGPPHTRCGGRHIRGVAVERPSSCPSRIRCQAATGSWTKSRQWETQRTLFSSAWATMCPPTKVDGVWPFNDAWLRTSL